jgi:ABC-2 type transport system permease protein
LLLGKIIPQYGGLLLQEEAILLFAVTAEGLRLAGGWEAMILVGLVWPCVVLAVGTAAATVARSPGQLSAATDVIAVVMAPLGGGLVPISALPSWAQSFEVASPGYWAVRAFHAAILDGRIAVVAPSTGILVTIGVSLYRLRHDDVWHAEIRAPGCAVTACQ